MKNYLKRDSDWQIANDYFKIMVDLETFTNENINTYVLRLQQTIHSYFKEQYGNVGDTQSYELYQRYGSVTKSKLKKNLRDLKKSYEINQNDILLNEIKYVSKLPLEEFSKEATVLKASIITNVVKKASGNIVRTFLKTSPKFSLSSVKINVTHILETRLRS